MHRARLGLCIAVSKKSGPRRAQTRPKPTVAGVPTSDKEFPPPPAPRERSGEPMAYLVDTSRLERSLTRPDRPLDGPVHA